MKPRIRKWQGIWRCESSVFGKVEYATGITPYQAYRNWLHGVTWEWLVT